MVEDLMTIIPQFFRVVVMAYETIEKHFKEALRDDPELLAKKMRLNPTPEQGVCS